MITSIVIGVIHVYNSSSITYTVVFHKGSFYGHCCNISDQKTNPCGTLQCMELGNAVTYIGLTFQRLRSNLKKM